MGYFRRKLRRSACAQERDRSMRADIPQAIASLTAGRRPRFGVTYRRFHVDDIHPDSYQSAGIFTALYALRGSRELNDSERTNVRRLLEWFRANLPAPRSVPPMAVFWFRSDARTSMSRIWKMVRLLRAHGRAVRQIKSATVGKVVFRDSQQIAAIPHDTR
jgi:hypothetical protein